MKFALKQRLGFLVNEVSRLYSQQFDRLAREKLGLTQAQCRLIAVLASHEGEQALSQADIAARIGMSAMAVATLVDRMEAGGWVERRAHPGDRRINHLYVKPNARKALERAMTIGDELSREATADLTPAERAQLIALLAKVRGRLAPEDKA
jgi:DNA-binding MarR family transcriptional regulator